MSQTQQKNNEMEDKKKLVPDFEQIQANVYKWAGDKDLLHEENVFAQLEKVKEEIGEIEEELIDDNLHNLRLEMGDGFVTLIILAYQKGLHPVDCLRAAWEKIENRKGVTLNGVFVRDRDN